MHVEPCCQALLADVLPVLDKKRRGVCIDVGVGTFAFYCELFARLGFDTIAVEPLPVEKLRQVCRQHNIRLFDYCVSEISGRRDLFIGTYDGSENLNVSSLLPDWWGASAKKEEVQSVTLLELLSAINPETVACLKLDVEGMEHAIIRQLPHIDPRLLPGIVVFEYGGGESRASGQKGWSSQQVAATMECLSILRQCGYSLGISVDGVDGTTERVFDVSVPLEPDQVFHEHAIYGNIVSLRGVSYPRDRIRRICSAYQDNSVSPPQLRVPGDRMRRIVRSLRGLLTT